MELTESQMFQVLLKSVEPTKQEKVNVLCLTIDKISNKYPDIGLLGEELISMTRKDQVTYGSEKVLFQRDLQRVKEEFILKLASILEINREVAVDYIVAITAEITEVMDTPLQKWAT